MSNLADFRTAIVASLQGLNESGWDLSSGRVLDGLVPFTRATGTTLWYTCLQSGSGGSGLLAIVGAGENLDKLRDGLPRFNCAVDVYAAVDADQPDTLSGVCSAVETVRRAMDGATNMGTTYGRPEFLRAGRVTVMHYTLECARVGCDVIIRYLVNENGVKIENETGSYITVP